MCDSLKFSACLLYLSYLAGCSATPVSKWRKPVVEGNVSLILIPQDISKANDSDVLVALKSDYKVLNYDMNLLNLVVNNNTGSPHGPTNLNTGQRNLVDQLDTANYYASDKDSLLNIENNTDTEKLINNNTNNVLKLLGLNNDSSVKEKIDVLKMLGLLNISSLIENHTSDKLTSATAYPISNSTNTFLEIALNKLKRPKSRYSESVGFENDDDFSNQEDNEINVQNKNSQKKINLPNDEGDDDLDYSVIEEADKSNVDEYMNTAFLNSTPSVCLPFFADINETDADNFGESNQVTENPVQMTSSEGSYNPEAISTSSFAADLNSTEIGNIDRSNNTGNPEGIITQNPQPLASKGAGGIGVLTGVTSSFNQIEDHNNLVSGWPLSAENQQPGAQAIGEQTECTTIIIKCNPVQSNEVFQQISKMVNAPALVTKSQEAEHGAGVTDSGHLTTPTILTECFPVNPGNVSQAVNNAAVAKKVTLEPPVDCVSRCNLKGTHTCATIAEPDAKVKEDRLDDPSLKLETLLNDQEDRANYIHEAILIGPRIEENRLPDLQRESSEMPTQFAKPNENNPYMLDMNDNVLFPLLLNKIKSIRGKNLNFQEGSGYRAGASNNNQCDPAANVSIEYPDQDNDQPGELSKEQIKSSTRLPIEMPTTQVNKEVFESHPTFQTMSSTEQRLDHSEVLLNIPLKTSTQFPSGKPIQGGQLEPESHHGLQTMPPTVQGKGNFGQLLTIPSGSSPSDQQSGQFERGQSISYVLTTQSVFSTSSISGEGSVTERGQQGPISSEPPSVLNVEGNVPVTVQSVDTTKLISAYDKTTFFENSLATKEISLEDKQKLTTNNAIRPANQTVCYAVTSSENIPINKANASPKGILTTAASLLTAQSLPVNPAEGELTTIKSLLNVNENAQTTQSLLGKNDKSMSTKCRIKTTTVQCKPNDSKVNNEKSPNISPKHASNSKVSKGNSNKLRKLLAQNLPFRAKSKNQQSKTQDNKEDIYIPVDSVKEIVIQIVKKPKQPNISSKNSILEKCKTYPISNLFSKDENKHHQSLQEKSKENSMYELSVGNPIEFESATRYFKQKAMVPQDYFKLERK